MDRRRMLLSMSSLTASWQSKLWGRFSPAAGGKEHDSDTATPGVDAALNPSAPNSQTGGPDIRKLTQHFFTEDFSPWMFIPQDNIKMLSTTEHPGFATIMHGDKGQDIKGILRDPIKIGDYPLPWEFHLGIAGETYMRPFNQAVGLNLALTFSDPSTWPKDRTQLPPDTHVFQLLNAHLRGPQIGSGPWNYYASEYPSPPDGIQDGHGGDPYVAPSTPPKIGEVWVLYGRGDVDPTVLGDWRIPYNWIGWPNGRWPDHPSGLLSHSLNFRVKVLNSTQIEVGFTGGLQGEPHLGWRMRTMDVSRFGNITGIWEIGPLIALDGWLSEDLPKELGISTTPALAVSDPSNIYMVDYAAFFGANTENFDHFSDDFDIPGFSSKYYHEAAAIVDTYTHPDYLTVTLLPQASAIWAMCPTAYGTGQLDLTGDFHGFEVEIGWIPPDEKLFPWRNFLTSFSMWTESGRSVGYGTPPGGGWTPGVEYDDIEKRVKFFSSYSVEGINLKSLDIKFEPEIPQSILAHKPIHMLMQIPDPSHLRMGFKANKSDPWYLSKPFDVTKVFGEKLGKIDPLIAFWGGVSKGSSGGCKGIGNYPRYPQFLIDYAYFRKGISTPR